jgi:spermidine/putrescine transport system substrate-binding protein
MGGSNNYNLRRARDMCGTHSLAGRRSHRIALCVDALRGRYGKAPNGGSVVRECLTRRQALGLASVVLVSAPMIVSRPALGQGTLRIWAYPDYIPAKLISEFEAKTGSKVVLDTYATSGEATAALTAGRTVDLLYTDSSVVAVLLRNGLLQPISAFDQLSQPMFSEVLAGAEEVLADAGAANHFLPLHWGVLGLGGTPALIGDRPSYGLLWSDTSPAKVTFPIRHSTIYSAALFLERQGKIDSVAAVYASEKQAEEVITNSVSAIMASQGRWVQIWDNFTQLKEALETHPSIVGLIHDDFGFELELQLTTDVFRWGNPLEGAIGWIDGAVLPTMAADAGLATEWMRYNVDPTVAALAAAELNVNSSVADTIKQLSIERQSFFARAFPDVAAAGSGGKKPACKIGQRRCADNVCREKCTATAGSIFWLREEPDYLATLVSNGLVQIKGG